MKKFLYLLSHFFGAGLFPKAPGTVASLVTLLLFMGAMSFVTLSGGIVVMILLFVANYLSIPVAVEKLKKHDPSQVVIDEVLGQFMASFLVFIILSKEALPAENLYAFVILSFLFFRFFDISKIFPVSYFDNLKSIHGVVLDDVVAGVMAAFSTIAVSKLFL